MRANHPWGWLRVQVRIPPSRVGGAEGCLPGCPGASKDIVTGNQLYSGGHGRQGEQAQRDGRKQVQLIRLPELE